MVVITDESIVAYQLLVGHMPGLPPESTPMDLIVA